MPPKTARPSRSNPVTDTVPIIALHGTLDSPGAWSLLVDELRDQGRRVYAPAYGERGTAALAKSVAEVEAYIARVCAETGSDTVDIVGHSQGGLIAFLLYVHQIQQIDVPRIAFRRVVSLSGSVGGVHLSGPSRVLAWRNGTIARQLMGQALANQLAVAAGKYPITARKTVGSTSPETSEEVTVPDWINVISHYDRLVIPWSNVAQSYLPESRTVLLDTELGGRSVPHWKQQTDPEVVALLARLLD